MGEYMKVDNIDEKLIVYLRDIDSDDLELLCEDVISKLKDYYNIELRGFYDVYIYIDQAYGTIMEFILEELDLYYDYSKVDLHIINKQQTFLYEVNDILDLNVDTFYLYQNKYYIPLEHMALQDFEFGRVVYHDTNDILNSGIKCKIS